MQYEICERTGTITRSCIRETPTLSAYADSSTNTMKSCFFDIFLHFWVLFINIFPLIFYSFCDISGTFCRRNKIMCHKSHVMCHMSHLMCNMSPLPVTNANSHRRSPTDYPITHRKLVQEGKKYLENPINNQQKIILKISNFWPIMQFWCPSRFRIHWKLSTNSILWKKTKKPNTLAIINKSNFCVRQLRQTDRRTWRLYDRVSHF